MRLRALARALTRLSPHRLDYPRWVRISHWSNVLFLSMVARSGIAILAAHPKLYRREDSLPIHAWARFTRREMPRDRLWCSSDEEVEWSSVAALPGGKSLGLGRYWHFFGSIGWIATGVFYVARMATSRNQWKRLIPRTSTAAVDAWRVAKSYLRGGKPLEAKLVNPLHPMNALQELTYFGVVFVLSPIAIATGLLQAPAILARLPKPLRQLEDRQLARSIHGVTLAAYGGFLAIHLAMVAYHGFKKQMSRIVWGDERETSSGAIVGLALVGATVAIHALAGLASRKRPRATQRALAAVVDPVLRQGERIAHISEYDESKISSYFRVNGYPPISAYPAAQGDDDTYERLYRDGFRDYRLQVHGLVARPTSFSLDELRALPRREQITHHQCIQGWSAIAKWAGVQVRELLARCEPLAGARYAVFWSFQMHEESGKPYYECLRLSDLEDEYALLAYEMNGVPLPIQHGAPLRLRAEKRLGFKMVKYLRSIELVRDYRDVGEGMGGVREDEQHYDMEALI